MRLPSTRKEALETGATHYFTGKPCSRGHIAIRKTKGACVECLKENWVKDNERRKKLPKSEASKEAGRRYYQKNKELVKAKALTRPVDLQREYRKRWKKRNPEKTQTLANAWKKRVRKAAPKWMTKEQKQQIQKLYLAARRITKETGVKYVVDHIVPLNSEVVCGLHVPWNMQLMTHEENCRKSNRWTGWE